MESKDSHLILHVGEGVASSSDSYSLEKRREVRNPQYSRKTRALSYLKLQKHSQIWALEKTCSKNMWVPQKARGPPPSSAPASKMASLDPFPENKFSLYTLLFKQKYGESEFIAIFFSLSFLWNQDLTPGANSSIIPWMNRLLTLHPWLPTHGLAQYRWSSSVYEMNELPVGSWSRVKCQTLYFVTGIACLRVTSLFWCVTWQCPLPNGLKDIPCVSSSAETQFTTWFSAFSSKVWSLVCVLMTNNSKEAKQILKVLCSHPPSTR